MSQSRPPSVPSARRAERGDGQARWRDVLADLLFVAASDEDMALLDGPARAFLSRATAAFLLRHRPARTQVRARSLDGPGVPARLRGLGLIMVLNDDMPFLVDSLLALLAERRCRVRLLLHPVLRARRDTRGRLLDLERRAGRRDGTRDESLILLLVEEDGASSLKDLARAIEDVHARARAAVLDWPAMREEVARVIEEWQLTPPPVPVSELTEMLAFLQWMVAEHFVFLGLRAGRRRLGVARTDNFDEITGAPLGPGERPAPLERGGQEPVLITKSAAISRVHRRAPMDLVILRRFDVAGNVIGELRILGLFTSTAYVRAAQDIPLLRRKIAEVLKRTGMDMRGHRGKRLLDILETFPRDDLFELDARRLGDIALDMMHVLERPRAHVIFWRGCSPVFVSAFVFIPRERFSSELRQQVGALLETALQARVAHFSPMFTESVLVRVHFRLRLLRARGWRPPARARLQERLADIVRSWEERLLREGRQAWGERAARILDPYRNAFSEGYKEAFSPRVALADVEIVERLLREEKEGDGGGIAVVFHHDAGDERTLRLKLYHFDTPLPLGERVPILANAGLDAIEERTFNIRRGTHEAMRQVFLHEMVLRPRHGVLPDERSRARLQEGFIAIWRARADNDRFNALMLAAGLDWRQVMVLRAIGRWLHQAGSPHGTGYVAETLCRHAPAARLLIAMFEVLLSPGRAGARARRRRAMALHERLRALLDEVQSLDEDRILRMYAQVVLALRRTNFWQPPLLAEGTPRPLALKIDTREVGMAPQPRPWAEIFVHDPQLEGVHLRGGPIARGGIRFSDRPQDFRTEILSLMKAQTVKNAVIVPVGAKGGFVARAGCAPRACYERFIACLLDMTDNIVDGRVRAPEKMARLDGEDPYLVVAADKGTARFSDIANALAARRGFWLDDAFAAGGSAGYDHKKMGITARGAWEAVRRHFREMDVNVDETPISVVGIGDMSGDVFGNGMLLSRHLRLIAAFDHRDIFIDPDPDPRIAWHERRRLFRLPSSSWQDYDRACISAGGGVFSRRAKSIPVSEQMRRALGIASESLTPNELIRAILRAPVDLIWFGGIGTYVRAEEERDHEVGDPANDSLRVSARQLRAKVVGEGANLGMTQKARVAYALAGGRVNMDAIDNSGGVNTSDIEVNIKIALGTAMRAGRLDRAARDRLLARMRAQVARLVLRNSYMQTLCISITQAMIGEEMGDLVHLTRELERRGALRRRVEELPDEATLRERARRAQWLTRPEIAVLMSWAKIVLFDDLLECGVVEDGMFAGLLHDYFPDHMRAHFAPEIDSHPLRREIIANRLANAMIDEGGPAFVSRLREQSGHDVRAIARAFSLARITFGFTDMMEGIHRLDNRVRASDQLRLYITVRQALRRACGWFLQHEDMHAGTHTLLNTYPKAIEWLRGNFSRVASTHARQRVRLRRAEFAEAGAPARLAARLALLPYLLRGLDIAAIHQHGGLSMEDAARAYFLLGRELRLSPLIMAGRRLRSTDHHEQLALQRLVEQLSGMHMRLVLSATRACPSLSQARRWLMTHEKAVRRLRLGMHDILGEPFSLARLALGVSMVEEFLRQTTSER